MGRIEKIETFDFQELIQDREDWVRSSKKNKFDFDSILTGLYNDPSHFIFEILQNAEDAGAKTVTFKLDENQLEITHDAKNNFNANDIAAITGIGVSTKKEDINAIGKFGVGFKSVFAITQTPEIHSGEYHFRIKDFVVPSPIETNKTLHATNITLPFNHKSRSQKEVFDLVQAKLENLGLQSLLFLKSIKEIKWQSPNKSGHYLKSSKVVDSMAATKKVTVISEANNGETLQDYFIFEKVFELDNKNLKVEVAFRIGRDDVTDKEIIVPVNNAKLTVYFPTEKDTYLNFLIQGPYKTTPNRENVPLGDEQNKFITDQIGELVSESISVLKKLGYLDLNLLNILPLEEKYVENNPIYSTIFEKVKVKLSSGEELLPTHDGKFTASEVSLLARGQDLVEIFTKLDIQFLFKKNHWLDTNITYDRTRKLRDYLVKVIGVKEIEFEDFARTMTAEFFAMKDDEWMANFYTHLNDQQSLWRYNRSTLRSKPIIRLENDSHIAPFNEKEDIQVYLPSKNESKYPTVKKTLTENKEALAFLKGLGLSEPNLFAEIRKFIIPKFETDTPSIEDDEYFEDFHKLLLANKEAQSTEQRELLSSLRNLPIIKAINPTTNKNGYRRPSEVYANDIELRLYFIGYESAYFVSKELHSRFDSQELDNFLKELGVMTGPQRIFFTPDLLANPSLRNKLESQVGSRWLSTQDLIDYDLEGLRHFFEQQVNPERSRILWNFLIQAIKYKSSYDAKGYFEAEYIWFRKRYKHSYKFEANFKKTLQQSRWLINRQDNLCSPFEISFSELSDEYNTDCSNLDVLKEVLGFRPDVFDQLPEDMKKKFEIIGNLSFEELENLISEDKRKKSEKEDTWKPQADPNNTIVKIKNIIPEILPSPSPGNWIDWLPTGDGKDSRTPETPKLPGELKEIGKWGEQYVFKALKTRLGINAKVIDTKYGCLLSNNEIEQKIHWLNIDEDHGKGCDLIIKQDDQEIEYIEVKTTIDDKQTLIIISGPQWEFARKLFNEGEGDKYFICRVFNAGTNNARIETYKNPVKLWQEGKIYAHPIQLKL